MALEYARSAYEKMPDNSAIGDTLGWAYYKKGSFAQASGVLIEVEAKEQESGNENPQLLYHLGMSLYKEGRLYDALKRLKKFKRRIDIQPDTLPQSVCDMVSRHIDQIENREFLDREGTFPIETGGAVPVDDDMLFEFPDNFLKKDVDILEPQWQKESLL